MYSVCGGGVACVCVFECCVQSGHVWSEIFLLYSGEWHSLWVTAVSCFLFIDAFRNSHGSMISQNQKLFCYTFYLETHIFIWTEQYEVQQLFQSGLVNLLMMYFDTTIKCTDTTKESFCFFVFYLVTYTLHCLTVLADCSLNYNCVCFVCSEQAQLQW